MFFISFLDCKNCSSSQDGESLVPVHQLSNDESFCFFLGVCGSETVVSAE